MSEHLKIISGQYSDKGRKKVNQDFHGIYSPKEPLLNTKGIAITLADGISSSDVSQEASEAAVNGFLTDYYCTSEAWSIKTSVQRVLQALNSWLYTQTRQSRYRFEEKDRGYVCTFSSLILKSNTAHIFHLGDSRVYRLAGGSLEQLTKDHRVWVSKEKSYLSRALGINEQLELDYQTLPIEVNDVFVLATDGVYEFVGERFIAQSIDTHSNDLDKAAQLIVEEAYRQGSDDNLTIQIIRITQLPPQDVSEISKQLGSLPFPPMLEPRMHFDGYQIIRGVHHSSRSHIYLALDTETNEQVILKTPSIDLRDNKAYLERFLLEEWIARRINNAHVLKPCQQTRQRNYTYVVTEFIEGQTLTQWMIDNPTPDIETVRNIIEQIATGLRAFHRQEMLHQDLRPANIMIDKSGTVKIIDFGATKVAGLTEIISHLNHNEILGTEQYSAPEYFLGESGTNRSDIYSLGVITYQMLSGRLPYSARMASSRTRAEQRKLSYLSVLDDQREIPAWIDETLKKAVHLDPFKRYGELSEFVYDLRHPGKAYINKTFKPLIERKPVLFWQLVSTVLLLAIFYLLATHPGLS